MFVSSFCSKFNPFNIVVPSENIKIIFDQQIGILFFRINISYKLTFTSLLLNFSTLTFSKILSLFQKNNLRGARIPIFFFNSSSEGLSAAVFYFLIFQILKSCFWAKLGAKSVSGKYPLRHGGGLAAGQHALPCFFSITPPHHRKLSSSDSQGTEYLTHLRRVIRLFKR